MATFQYEAINTKNGKTENGELPAASQAEIGRASCRERV